MADVANDFWSGGGFSVRTEVKSTRPSSLVLN